MSPRVRHQLLGAVFLVIAALFVLLSVAFYRKAFVEVVPVRLETDRAGNQLRVGADVKLRGLVVGEVREIRSVGDTAVLDLALDPDHVARVPASVSARLLPKTLFGERYVALVAPPGRSEPIAANAVIGQDRSAAAIEIEQVLDHLMPVLQAVQPDELASTLNAMATALDGRGAQLGDTLVRLGAYLGELRPSLPDLRADIQRLAEVADTYTEAAPDLLAAMRDLTTTTRTVVEQRANLRELYGTLTTATVELHDFLAANRDNLIALVSTSRSTLEVLAEYAPEYPCLLEQLVDAIPSADRAFGKGSAHPDVTRVTIEITSSRGKYLPGVDTPRYEDDRGPRCYPVARPPARFPQYPPGGPLRDGSTKPPPPRSDRPEDFQPTVPESADAPALANSPAERELLGALLGPRLGVAPTDVPAWSSLLVGPLYRGAEVTLR
ncbi:MCE family protein [Actinophytocola xanthii]|uniref:ABC transporter substrate-binding protein n=1 Tax=Actinophytocola xanthii TaxID=1912961 RepID=A0A1Q8CX70_9PSEU|nr:MCE family protein [Actinophytocola xanthii]OLF18950.1 ABC transporter substrate-binding protein [Actinophytocola xanthii]